MEILDELDLARVVYIGHSIGATVGFLATQFDAARFERMILLNFSPRYFNEDGCYGGFELAELETLFSAMALSKAAQ